MQARCKVLGCCGSITSAAPCAHSAVPARGYPHLAAEPVRAGIPGNRMSSDTLKHGYVRLMPRATLPPNRREGYGGAGVTPRPFAFARARNGSLLFF